MNLEDYRTLFLVATLGLTLLAASPAVAVVLPEVGSERFSEFWLLGPDHMADGYPFDVRANEEYGVFVGVGNHMGDSEYYHVIVKFGNGTVSLPDVDGGVPSSLPPLHEYRFFVNNSGVWESAVTFGYKNVVIEDDVLSVGELIVDGVSFPVDVSAVWDSERGGYFFELFFELWRYDVESHSFGFHGQIVGIWLNMSRPQ